MPLLPSTPHHLILLLHVVFFCPIVTLPYGPIALSCSLPLTSLLASAFPFPNALYSTMPCYCNSLLVLASPICYLFLLLLLLLFSQQPCVLSTHIIFVYCSTYSCSCCPSDQDVCHTTLPSHYLLLFAILCVLAVSFCLHLSGAALPSNFSISHLLTMLVHSLPVTIHLHHQTSPPFTSDAWKSYLEQIFKG